MQDYISLPFHEENLCKCEILCPWDSMYSGCSHFNRPTALFTSEITMENKSADPISRKAIKVWTWTIIVVVRSISRVSIWNYGNIFENTKRRQMKISVTDSYIWCNCKTIQRPSLTITSVATQSCSNKWHGRFKLLTIEFETRDLSPWLARPPISSFLMVSQWNLRYLTVSSCLGIWCPASILP